MSLEKAISSDCHTEITRRRPRSAKFMLDNRFACDSCVYAVESVKISAPISRTTSTLRVSTEVAAGRKTQPVVKFVNKGDIFANPGGTPAGG